MPLIAVPIRTETVIRRTPSVNFALIAANALVFLLFDARFAGEGMWAFRERYLHLLSYEPSFHQFFTYQFIHADLMHLLGNMLFLWVFGNSVNSKMGNGPYLLFYLAGGVFAGLGHALFHPNPLAGASGAVAAVTTAYLALFPRSRVTVLIWFFLFIHFVEVPAMLIIGLKIIVWDNIIAPTLGESERVAHLAHLAGYLFGFVAAMGMLLVRALPRDQFDILALWKRWRQRRELASVMAQPGAAAWAQYGAVGRTAPVDPEERAVEDRRLDEIADMRARIGVELERKATAAAATLYEQLLSQSPSQCLAEPQQLEVAREFYASGKFTQAAAAFDRFVECYPNSLEASNVRLLVGIIYARDLRQYEAADKHLTQSMASLRDQSRRDQCLQWLKNVRAALGRPAPQTTNG
jgi:membrane associated rhomboid family serine protease